MWSRKHLMLTFTSIHRTCTVKKQWRPFTTSSQTETLKKVAVIGAGPTGVATLKTAKEYGHHVTCFELQPSFGGQWLVTPDMHEDMFEPMDDRKKHGMKCVYKSLLFNNSIYNSIFSDFPVEVDINNAFWTPTEYMAYLTSYVEHFNLEEYIMFNTVVEKLEKRGRKWRVKYDSTIESQKEAGYAEFDHVIIASGPFRHPLIPSYKDRDQFQGTAIHSGQVRNDELLFKGKRVVVVGYGNSGVEIACCALQANAEKVYISMSYDAARRQHWTGKRYHSYPDNSSKKPWDCYKNRHRYLEHPEKFIDFLKSWMIPTKNITVDYTPRVDGINVTHVDIMTQREQDGILEKVVDIDHFFKDGMQLVDGTHLDNIDIIVFATGFQTRYPFLDEVWDRHKQKLCELYKYVVPTEEALDGVSFLSTAGLLGSFFPVMEMQARYTCEKVLTRPYSPDGYLFSETERQHMLEDVTRQRHYNKELRRPYNFHTDGIGYVLQLAKEIGCDPKEPSQMFQQAKTKKDIELGVALEYGPLIGVQYRLRGAFAWDGAADFLIHTARNILEEQFDKLVKQHMKNC